MTTTIAGAFAEAAAPAAAAAAVPTDHADWRIVTDADQPITRRVILDEALPVELLLHRIEVREIRMRAGYAPGAHVHNGPVFGTIAAGHVLFRVDDRPERLLAPGDPFYEPAGVVIWHFDALDEDVTFIAHFPLQRGQDAELTMID